MPKPPWRSAQAKTLVRLYTKLRQGYEQHKHCHILRLKHLFCLLRVPSMGLGFWACSRGFFEVDLALGGGGIIDLDSTLRNRTSIESNWVKSGGLILFFIIFIFDSDYKYEFEICQERGKWIVRELFCNSKKWSDSRGDSTIQKTAIQVMFCLLNCRLNLLWISHMSCLLNPDVWLLLLRSNGRTVRDTATWFSHVFVWSRGWV